MEHELITHINESTKHLNLIGSLFTATSCARIYWKKQEQNKNQVISKTNQQQEILTHNFK